MTTHDFDKNSLYLIYDNECPLCRSSAHALNIKKAVGNLVLINAREAHPLISLAYARGFDPDRGIIVIYNGQYYFGADAAHFLAMLNSSHGMLNAITASIFRIKIFARLLYPIVKIFRRLLLKIKGIGAIELNEGSPLFEKVFADEWQKLSPFMKKRFGNRPYSNDQVLVTGTMTIKSSRWMRLIKPLLKMTSPSIPHDGENIAVTVKFKSEPGSSKYWFDREFITHQACIKSYMLHIKNNIMVELMRFNMGWCTKFSVNEDSVLMSHYGYVFRCFNLCLPLPIELVLGRCNVVERQISDEAFSMEMNLTHFLFGQIYQYKGIFKMSEENN